MQTTNAHSFTEHLSEFYHYLTGPGGVNAHSRTNYISWLKFLDEQGYALTELQSYDDIDDLLATGGTMKAAAELVESLGGKVVKIIFIMELAGLKGREQLAGYDVDSVIVYPGK